MKCLQSCQSNQFNELVVRGFQTIRALLYLPNVQTERMYGCTDVRIHGCTDVRLDIPFRSFFLCFLFFSLFFSMLSISSPFLSFLSSLSTLSFLSYLPFLCFSFLSFRFFLSFLSANLFSGCHTLVFTNSCSQRRRG